MNHILTAQGLKKTYDGKTVLDVDHMKIEEGKITAIIGPSGSGKTTLLSIINGLVKPDEGSVIFRDDAFTATKNYSASSVKKMAMVFQKPVMFNTTVHHNIAYGLKVRKLRKETIQQKLKEAASWMGISELLTQKAITLSGGEAGRVSVARAMILEPDLLLMDEPTANLDPANVSIIENMVLKMNREYGTTVVIVTHNMFQAKRLAHNLLFLLNGQIIEEGSSSYIFGETKDKRTQAFVSGNMVY